MLGRHATVEGGLPAVVVRTLQPRASSVELVVEDRAIPMRRRLAAGVFEVTMPWSGPPHELGYRLRVHEGAAVRELVDPYQFGPV